MMADTNAEDTNGLAKSEIKLPLHEDIMQLACRGEVGPIQNLLDEGKFDATYKDEEGITPLHVGSCTSYLILISPRPVGSDQ